MFFRSSRWSRPVKGGSPASISKRTAPTLQIGRSVLAITAIEAASDTVASVGLAPEGEIGTDTFGSLFADEYAIDD